MYGPGAGSEILPASTINIQDLWDTRPYLPFFWNLEKPRPRMAMARLFAKRMPWR